MGGYSNVDDLVLNAPGAPYRGVALRSFDPKSQQWSIWWLDGRTPLGPLDPPMRIHSSESLFRLDSSGPTSPPRPVTQAYSPDGGKTWETNWVQPDSELE